VTINQVVAWNMAYFRKAAGLTQEELGERLGWSKAIVSAAERSWDSSNRVRQFSVDDLLGIAMALVLPLTALFLPPADDGVGRRYVFSVGPEQWNMESLLSCALSEPTAADTPVMIRYRERFTSAINTYVDPDRVEELAQYAEDLTTADRLANALGRLRYQHDALRSVLADNDRLQEALSERLARGPRNDQGVAITGYDREPS
jgi:transcriptional regulator with XRE-family HTH domain